MRHKWQWPALLPLLSHPDADVKWCGAQCLGVALNGGDALTGALVQKLLTPEEIGGAALRWHTAGATIAMEQAATLRLQKESSSVVSSKESGSSKRKKIE